MILCRIRGDRKILTKSEGRLKNGASRATPSGLCEALRHTGTRQQQLPPSVSGHFQNKSQTKNSCFSLVKPKTYVFVVIFADFRPKLPPNQNLKVSRFAISPAALCVRAERVIVQKSKTSRCEISIRVVIKSEQKFEDLYVRRVKYL